MTGFVTRPSSRALLVSTVSPNGGSHHQLDLGSAALASGSPAHSSALGDEASALAAAARFAESRIALRRHRLEGRWELMLTFVSVTMAGSGLIGGAKQGMFSFA